MPISTPDATNQATTDADTRQQSNVLPNEAQQPPDRIQPQMEIAEPDAPAPQAPLLPRALRRLAPFNKPEVPKNGSDTHT